MYLAVAGPHHFIWAAVSPDGPGLLPVVSDSWQRSNSAKVKGVCMADRSSSAANVSFGAKADDALMGVNRNRAFG
jgi:hypothetical protein